MKIIKNVQSSNKSFTQLEFNVDTIYIRSNERKWYDDETKEHIGWAYDEIQMSYNQFVESFTDQFGKFKEDVISNNDDIAMSLVETLESVFDLEDRAIDTNNDVAMAIVEIMENQIQIEDKLDKILEEGV